MRYCDECGGAFDAPRCASKPPVCDECREPRHQRQARERYARWTAETRERWNAKRRERYARARKSRLTR